MIPEDVKEVSLEVLAHRIILRPGEQATAADAINEVLDTVPVPV